MVDAVRLEWVKAYVAAEARAPGGILLVHPERDQCAYILCCDLEASFPSAFSEALISIVQKDGGEHAFFVLERGRDLTVVQALRSQLAEILACNTDI